MKNKCIYGNFFLIFVLLFSFSPAFARDSSSYDYDVLIQGGNVFDGSLKRAFKADVAVKNGKIVKIASAIRAKAKHVINASKLHITPGFIDLHTHAERGMYFPENRAGLNYLRQGVTTVVVGQCGISAWPIFEKIEDQVKRWSGSGIGLNAALLVGHGFVRRKVMGNDDREPTPEELAQMKTLVKEAMEQGAYGLSTGLIYEPGKYAKTDEIIELVKVIVPYGGIYHSHIRNEWDKHLEAVREAIEIGEKTGVPVHISHLKVVGIDNWGKLKDACQLIETAQKKGLKITADQYPYRFTNNYPYKYLVPMKTWLGDAEEEILEFDDIVEVFDYLRDSQLIALYKKVSADPILSVRHQQYLEELPRKELVKLVSRSLVNPGELHGPGNKKERLLFLERLKNPPEAEKIRKEVKDYIYQGVNPKNFIIARCIERSFEGKSLKEAAKIKGKSLEDTAIELHLMGTLAVPFRMSEEDIEYAMKKWYVATGSDGTVPFYGIDLPHIRSYSTFLHKIKKYGLKRKAVSIPHIIRSQTSLPAGIMNWNDRGWIKPGYIADIAVINLKKIKTNTSISNPHCWSSGVEYLLVNGDIVIDKGRWNGKLPGKVIKLKKPHR
ncbi:MAG: amidohydrolase family protein [Candidatus Aminicenantes bacterium]|nr:amidohydrolase family protein [Candidatus Aminicenantes bacterium]NIM84300.1 amidohydrolase family protein [Candidatus Aminicenantes bacterium]NIN23786.1 amidohydrolase family protein [Candidatus Aminicenantes bacterium]NIN47502.1 amidohydrolase family protein [Candidatus Aminicenantes bacterium]NIN90422.1 amidohydrolase family protein [Candidatus Aminicenantes bacterium]